MSAISTILTRLRAAIWAIDVRDDIANAIEQCYSDVSNPTLRTEALEAALQNKIDQGKMAALTIGDGTITGAKLANGTIPKSKLDPSITFDADAALDTTSTNAIQNKVVAGAISTLQADLDAYDDAIREEIGDIGWDQIVFTSDSFIDLSGSTADVTHMSSPAYGFSCAVVQCSAGDKFLLNLTGGGRSRAWGFVAANGNIISVADANATVSNYTLTAPTNAAYLVVHDSSGKKSYKKGETIAERIESKSDFSDAAKTALLACIKNCAWTDEDGQDYYDALQNVLFTDALVADFVQNSVIDYGTDLGELDGTLTVKLVQPNGTYTEITDYELSGTLDREVSTVTVTTRGRTATFNVICAPSGRWVNNVLTILSNELVQGGYNGEPPTYHNTATTRVLYYGAKIDIDPRYKYTITAQAAQGSPTIKVAAMALKKIALKQYAAGERLTNGGVDSGWQNNGYVYNANGEAVADEIRWLIVPTRLDPSTAITPSDISSITITRTLL